MGPLVNLFRALWFRVGVLLVLAVAALWGGPLRAPLQWVVFGYLLWRAWPAVADDLGGLVGRLRAKPRGAGGVL